MSRQQIIDASLKINKAIFSLNPSAVVTLFVIDLSDLAFNYGIYDRDPSSLVFRFHNNLKLTASDILFNTDKEFNSDGSEILHTYIAAPIVAERFEYSGRGTLPTPKLSITVQEQNIQLMATLKQEMFRLGDLSGVKVTRIRTLAKHLNPENFQNGDEPTDLDNDPYAEFPREVFYIDRKSAENKSYIEFELASVLDVQGVQLPNRPVSSTRCPFQYRGEGCMYEFEYRQRLGVVDTIHGYMVQNRQTSASILTERNSNRNILPSAAPPVATVNDEKIIDILYFREQSSLINMGLYSPKTQYKKGDFVYIQKDVSKSLKGVKYYYVCKNNNPTTAPPNTTDWIADQCSKRLRGCKLRYGREGALAILQKEAQASIYSQAEMDAGYSVNNVHFGGFPATQRAS